MRILLQVVLPLIAPIIIYSIWSYWEAKRLGKGMPSWEEGNWFWAALIGVFLSVATLIYVATTGAGTNTKYISPHLENGKIIPGQHN